jgi:hypothetical protein
MHRHEMQQSNIYLGIYIIGYYFVWKNQGVTPSLKLAVTERGGGGVAELRRGIEGKADRWSVCQGAEVGGGSAQCDSARGEAVTLG